MYIKILHISLIILLLIACNGNPRDTKSDLPVEEIKAVKEKLDSNLVAGVLDLIQSGEHLKYPDIPLNESFIAVTFKVNPQSAQIYFSDSIVEISYNIFLAYDNKNYKGMLNIDSCNIAIFDMGNFGESYYNTDSIKQISLDRFKSYPMSVILMVVYYVKNGKLNYWCP